MRDAVSGDDLALFDLPEPEPDPGRFLEPDVRQRTRRVTVREHERTIRMPDVETPTTVAGAAATSKQAAERHLPRSGTKRHRIFDMIRDRGETGATDDEIEQTLELLHQSASAGRNTLATDGWIVDSGQRRPTRSGNPAIVWVLSIDARRALDAAR